jgi:hypothetical protein
MFGWLDKPYVSCKTTPIKKEIIFPGGIWHKILADRYVKKEYYDDLSPMIRFSGGYANNSFIYVRSICDIEKYQYGSSARRTSEYSILDAIGVDRDGKLCATTGNFHDCELSEFVPGVDEKTCAILDCLVKEAVTEENKRREEARIKKLTELDNVIKEALMKTTCGDTNA